MAFDTLMGDEAIALGAVHAGLGGAFAYPGTPSTEIMEYLQDLAAKRADGKASGNKYVAQWCANEKTAYESALGASFAGCRAMVSMKHVGLNVAMDPFVNSSLVKINGGLVVVIADDPGMHSSQDEQDSRWLADFARIPCFEPADQQEAYDMTIEAFDLSEKLEIPVMLRITTRLAHSRSVVQLKAECKQNAIKKPAPGMEWCLMPAISRRRWKELLGKQTQFRAISEDAAHNPLVLAGKKLGIITTGLALQYYKEIEEDYAGASGKPNHLHIGFYPIPEDKIRKIYENSDAVLVVEEGYPLVERLLRGIMAPGKKIMGKESGEIPYDGELSTDIVRKALGLQVGAGLAVKDLGLPGRPPQFCMGCPHADSFNALTDALKDYPIYATMGDIGCYALGALAPYSAIETIVAMGASIGMARGAAELGLTPSVAVIGDSTFYHSGLTNLIDAVSHNTNMTVLILDNDTTGMTGAQPTILPSSKLESTLKGIGIHPDHIKTIRAHKNEHEKNVAVIKAELAYEGPSVVVLVRECIEAIKKARKA